MIPYADYKPLTFHDATRRFTDGNDSPRSYLERCLETIAQREPMVKALVVTNETDARAAADASAARCKAGRPLSPIDGMPVGIKELLEPKVSLLCKLRAAHERQTESRNADDREDIRINSAKRNLHGYMQ